MTGSTFGLVIWRFAISAALRSLVREFFREFFRLRRFGLDLAICDLAIS